MARISLKGPPEDRPAVRYQYPMEGDFLADLRLPWKMSKLEADRICAFIQTLVGRQ